MQEFYEIFPYPNRWIFLKPQKDIFIHYGFLKFAEIYPDKAQKLWMQRKSPFILKIFQNLKARSWLKKEILANEKINISLVGCGTDEPLLFKRVYPKASIQCLDLSRHSLDKARKKILFHRMNIQNMEFLPGDAKEILPSLEKADLIQCYGVLHHQKDPEEFFKVLMNSLNPKGFLRVMIYSHVGRRIERRIQKRYAWHTEPILETRIHTLKKYHYLLMMNHLWQRMLPWSLWRRRFGYLKGNSTWLADAFLHPSDPGLSLEKIKKWIQDGMYRIAFVEAKIWENDSVITVGGYLNQENSWLRILQAEEKSLIMSNIVIILQK